ncbi:MAG: LicD family protein [Lachnospiraceae bacterium]|nr:LicD family protein [Lachnospiraceae bacterium]
MGKWTNWKKEYGARVAYEDYYKPTKDAVAQVLKHYTDQGKKIAIWGGGVKGTAFLHIVDKKTGYVSCAIDIKKDKVGTYIAGREIVQCYDIKNGDVDVILMMNQKHFVQNYNILKDQNVECIIHDVDEIVKRKLTAKDILAGKDMEQDENNNRALTEKIQIELMPLLHEVKRVCEKHDIPYFLCAGSALGAVRHQGFIPWDDDIDIGMLRKDYTRFLEVARKELKEGFLLIDAGDVPDYYVGHAKVFKDNTALVNRETSHLRIHHGFYLDIFPFDTVPEEEKTQDEMRNEFETIKSKYVFMKKWNAYDGKNPIKKYFANQQYYKYKKYSSKKVFAEMNRVLTRYLDSDSTLVADMFAPYNKKLFYDLKDIYPVKYMQFEDGEYPVPGNCDRYLTVMYGDYMTLPPEDKRYVKHNIICFDSEHNYPPDKKWMKKYYKKRG